uniref:Surface protein 1 n=1 Tax=Sarcocystis neurona TaxID=42890 RepID=A8W918_SARNE|nr:surface protein 1 [Sarcocystis neurona]
MANFALRFVAFVIVSVFHLCSRPVHASFETFLTAPIIQYGLSGYPLAVRHYIAWLDVIQQCQPPTVDRALQTQEGQEAYTKAVVAVLLGALDEGVNVQHKEFYMQLLKNIQSGAFLKALRDESQRAILQEYLDKKGRSRLPQGFSNKAVQTASHVGVLLVTCVALPLVLMH